MPEHTYHEYHCVNCGAPLTPDDVVYDISGIAFFGALPGDYSQFPIYASKEKMEALFSWNEGKGRSIITLFDWITIIYEQCGDVLDPGTREKDAESAYRKFLDLLKTQKEQEEYGAISLQVAVIPGLPDNLSRVLVNNCSEGEVCQCTIQYDRQYGYSILDFAGRPNRTSFSDHRRCKHSQCRSMLLERAFQCEHTLIGFIGFQKVGKTCLIAALCKYLDTAAPGCQLLLRPNDEPSFRREIRKYQNGFSLKKTQTDGILKVNPTIYLQDGDHAERMLTFVDIAGEAFNNEQGRFDPALMENNFRAIADCSLYIYCTSLSAFASAEFGSMQRSLESFVKHLSRSNEKTEPGPIMIAVMQMDEPTTCIESKKDVPYLEDYLFYREFNQIYNVCESDQLKSSFSSETDRRDIDTRLQSFLTSVNTMLYYTPITCSAYGRQPVNQINIVRMEDDYHHEIKVALQKCWPVQIVINEFDGNSIKYTEYKTAYGANSDTIEIVTLAPDGATNETQTATSNNVVGREDQLYDSSPLRFKPSPRNINLIYDWIMRMIGEREIPSRSKDKEPLPPMTCQHLSIHEYHTNEIDVQAIARMFVNPHKYDIKFFKLVNGLGLLIGLRKRSFISDVADAKKKGEPLYQ